MDRREMAWRLGAPYHRCERCRGLTPDPLRHSFLWMSDMKRMRTCAPCHATIDRENREHVKREAADQAGLARAQEDVRRQLEEPSSGAYRQSCAAMMAEDPSFYRKFGY